MLSILETKLNCICTYDDWSVVMHAGRYYVINDEEIQEVQLVRQESTDNLEAIEGYLDWSYDFIGESDDCKYLLGFNIIYNSERMRTIAYNAIVLGKLEEQLTHETLLEELGCTEEEFSNIME